MRIALLSFNHAVYETSFAALAKMAIAEGHEVTAFYHPDGPRPQNPKVRWEPCRWWEFELKGLHIFKPDRVLIFNGSFTWCNAASYIIRSTWPTVFAEMAWLPQKRQLYIDPKGPGARSELFKTETPWVDPVIARKTAKYLKDLYQARPLRIALPQDFLLVPLQIEEDTSLLYDSPWFKTMHSLIGFLKEHFPAHPIVVKQHPACKKNYTFDGCRTIGADVPFNELVPYARAVIGINSTTLIESLIHEKPVMTFGLNVASNRGVFLEGKEAFANPERILSWTPPREKIHSVLHYLKALQFSAVQPPKSALERILRSVSPSELSGLEPDLDHTLLPEAHTASGTEPERTPDPRTEESPTPT